MLRALHSLCSPPEEHSISLRPLCLLSGCTFYADRNPRSRCCICAGGGVISLTFISIEAGRFKANNEVRSRITAKQRFKFHRLKAVFNASVDVMWM